MNLRRRTGRIVTVAVGVMEIVLPLYVVPRLAVCCWPPSADWRLLWALLAVALPPAVFLTWTVATSIINQIHAVGRRRRRR